MTRFLVVLLCFTAARCGGDPATTPPHHGAVRLAIVGDPTVVFHPGETRTLSVVLAEDEVGVVPGALVHFEIDGDPGMLTVASRDETTGRGGVAAAAFTAGGSMGSVDVVATAPGFDAAEVRFSIEVVPVRKLLRIVAGPGTLVDPGGETASVTVASSSSIPLRVRAIDADTGAPIPGDPLFFSLPGSALATFASTGGKSARATTNSAGEAQAYLVAAAEEPLFEARASSAAGSDGVYFTVTVLGEHPGPPCDADCDPGPIPPDPAVPDVTGVWYTRHTFAIRDSLPPGIGEAFAGIRAFDQFLSGRLGLPGWLQAVIDSLLTQFLPNWFYAVVRLADDAGTLLSYLRAEGKMRLSPGEDAAHPKGSEVWTSLVFYWLPLCGESIEGDPEVPPECARLDVTTAQAEDALASPRCRGEVLPAVQLHAEPFSATVEPVPGASPGSWQLAIDRRQVDVEISRAVVSAVGAALSLSTPWQCIAEATDCRGGQDCMVDCAGLGRWVSDFTAGVLPGEVVQNACAGVVRLAGEAATDLLASVRFDSDLLVFGGRATIGGVGDDDSTCRGGERCAGQLGNDDFDADLRFRPAARDGAWTGAFFRQAPGDMPGSWEAKRRHFQ